MTKLRLKSSLKHFLKLVHVLSKFFYKTVNVLEPKIHSCLRFIQTRTVKKVTVDRKVDFKHGDTSQRLVHQMFEEKNPEGN